MKSQKEFDLAFEKLKQELDSMTGKEFFGMFGVNIDSLPSINQSNGQ